ncbi:unnamed protein product [Prunus armeniaca]|uniref:Uncharacterized protein n=1 Tax=Prunus armeniaca TaxID=36596 RepID=A0A6J5VZY1_PRUAR|nr:unnamed protein product [Prunus armeniaca]
MVKASEFSEGQDEEEDDARTVETDPGFKIGSLIYQRSRSGKLGAPFDKSVTISPGKLFQEKAREVDEESNEMILRTRNIEIQGETVLDHCMDIVFFRKKAREADNESNEISLDETLVKGGVHGVPQC